VQGIENRQVTLPRHAKGHVDAVKAQLVDENAPAAAQIAAWFRGLSGHGFA
jgi:hypothetical protein